MNYYFHPEAEAEFIAAIDYYEEKQSGLGYDFAREVYTGIKSIIEHPLIDKSLFISNCFKFIVN